MNLWHNSSYILFYKHSGTVHKETGYTLSEELSALSIKGSSTGMLYRAVVYHFSLKKMCIHRKAKDEILQFNRKSLIDLIGTKISPWILIFHLSNAES